LFSLTKSFNFYSTSYCSFTPGKSSFPFLMARTITIFNTKIIALFYIFRSYNVFFSNNAEIISHKYMMISVLKNSYGQIGTKYVVGNAMTSFFVYNSLINALEHHNKMTIMINRAPM
jgi:hypothetical protein